jgi:hypothetical protein
MIFWGQGQAPECEELVLNRLLKASRTGLWRALEEDELGIQWDSLEEVPEG